MVIKLGGSLLDLPDLRQRLIGWLESRRPERPLLVVGGGPTADIIRRLDERHQLGQETSHWLALRALSVNSHVAANLVPQARIVGSLGECAHVWQDNRIPILDPYEFLRHQEQETGAVCLPHTWDVTSDSIAAFAAGLLQAQQLILLKSTDLPEDTSLCQACTQGLLDPYMLHLRPELPPIQWINFRTQPLRVQVLSLE